MSLFDGAGGIKCDCGHLIDHHRGDPHVAIRCHWAPPHSDMRCACTAPTTTGISRDEVYNSRTAPKS